MLLDTTTPQVQAALLSLCGVAASILGSMYVARRNIHKDARSRARVEWSMAFRAALSDLVSSVDQLRRAKIDGNAHLLPDRNTEVLRAKVKLLLLLNGSAEHTAFETALNRMSDAVIQPGLYYDPEKDIAMIVSTARNLLLTQWKLAANGK